MKKLLAAMLAFGFLGASAHAATLMKGSKPTRLEAAQAAASYHVDKALGGGVYRASDFSKVSAGKVKGTDQKILVRSMDRELQFNVTTRKLGASSYTAFLPNKKVPTPINAGSTAK
jgi:hypothetical protein